VWDRHRWLSRWVVTLRALADYNTALVARKKAIGRIR
jgi:hypothetical protein